MLPPARRGPSPLCKSLPSLSMGDQGAMRMGEDRIVSDGMGRHGTAWMPAHAVARRYRWSGPGTPMTQDGHTHTHTRTSTRTHSHTHSRTHLTQTHRHPAHPAHQSPQPTAHRPGDEDPTGRQTLLHLGTELLCKPPDRHHPSITTTPITHPPGANQQPHQQHGIIATRDGAYMMTRVLLELLRIRFT